MYTLIIFAGIAGFFFLYHTSLKMKMARNSGLPAWSAQNRNMARGIGAGLLAGAIAALVWKNGLGAGLFTGLLLLMVTSSLIIVLAPLQLLTTGKVLTALAFCLVLELLIFH